MYIIIYLFILYMWFQLILDLFIFYDFLLIYKEDRHVALTAQSAVNVTWRGLEPLLRTSVMAS